MWYCESPRPHNSGMQARHGHVSVCMLRESNHIAHVLNIAMFQHNTSQRKKNLILSLHKASEGGPMISLDFTGNEIDSGRLNNLPKVKRLISYRVRLKPL